MGGRRDLWALRERVRAEAAGSSGVLSRDTLTELGVDPRMIRREIAAQRWLEHGRQTIATHTGPLEEPAHWWRAVWEVGADVAALDGVSALAAAGMTGFSEEQVHVSVKHTAAVQAPSGVRLHKVIRRVAGEILDAGVPRTRPDVAAVRAAHWAVSARQAALVMVMPVQQRIITGQQLVAAACVVRGRNRRKLIWQLAHDIADGAQSLGELDFAQLCRRRGLPEPSRQAVRRASRGRVYLDVEWEEIGLAVEIDGSGHRSGLAVTDDNLRQNELVLEDRRVLRIDLIGLRVATDSFMDQVCAAHAACVRGIPVPPGGLGIPRTGGIRGG
jgi:very-short-patch-repair endonuclease